MPQKLVVEILAGPNVGESYEFEEDAILVGRGSQCGLQLPSPHVSRQQCELSVQGDQVILENLGSVNGTYLNDRPIDRVYVQDGDLITFCDVALRVRIPRPGQQVDPDRTVAYAPGQEPPGKGNSPGAPGGPGPAGVAAAAAAVAARAQQTAPPAPAPPRPGPRPPTDAGLSPGMATNTQAYPALNPLAGAASIAPPPIPSPPPAHGMTTAPPGPTPAGMHQGPPNVGPGGMRAPSPPGARPGGMPGPPPGMPRPPPGMQNMRPGGMPGPPPGMPHMPPGGGATAPPAAGVQSQRQRPRRKKGGGRPSHQGGPNIPLIRNVVVAFAVVMALLTVLKLVVDSRGGKAKPAPTPVVDEGPAVDEGPTVDPTRTTDEILEAAKKYFGTADNYLRNYRISDDSLWTAIQYFKKARAELRYVDPAQWPSWAQEIDSKIAQAEGLLDQEFSSAKLNFVKDYQSGNFEGALKETNRVMRMIPDKEDERHKYMKNQSKRIKRSMKGKGKSGPF